MSDTVREIIDDGRAQLHTGDMFRWLLTAGIVFTVLVIVINEALSTPALATGGVEQVCGLCHVDWRRQATALLSILGLVAVANWLLGGPQLPDEDDDE